MRNKPLEGKRIAIFVENKFIPEEVETYRVGFAFLGADVEFVSRIWYGDWKPDSHVFYSDIDPNDNEPWESPQRLTVSKDISQMNLDDYAAVIMSANYTSVRLRWEDIPQGAKEVNAQSLVQSSPTVRFFYDAMNNKTIVKGFLCHGLWILTPNPSLLRGRKVTCHTVVMADILNCGAEIVFEKDQQDNQVVAKVVTDGDLVTGYSKHEVLPFIEAISKQISH